MSDIIHRAMLDSDGIHEPKGHTTAQDNETYVSDGADSGAWGEPELKGVSSATADQIPVATGSATTLWTDINDFIQYSSICVFFDQATSGTRVVPVGSIDTILPLNLTYGSSCNVGFSYNDTTKETTYTGTQILIARFDASFSIAMPSGIGVTLEVWLQEDQGAGFVTIDKTLAVRKFSNNDVGIGGMTALLTIQNGYKYRPVFRVDGACTIDVENITYNFTGLRDLSI